MSTTTGKTSKTRKPRVRQELTQNIQSDVLAKLRSEMTGEPVTVPPTKAEIRAARQAAREARKAQAKAELLARAATHHLVQVGLQAHFDACQNPQPLFGPLLNKTVRNIRKAEAERAEIASAAAVLVEASLISEEV